MIEKNNALFLTLINVAELILLKQFLETSQRFNRLYFILPDSFLSKCTQRSSLFIHEITSGCLTNRFCYRILCYKVSEPF